MKTDFPIKGFHIDLRIQVMPMAALRKFAAELAGFGLNTLLVEWEASYPYDKHAIISNEYAYTRQEVQSFISYCARLGIEVIPLQQCFGHVEYILRHERYAHLRESNKDICQLCPLKKNEAYEVFGELLADMAALHSSKYIHIGGDETYLLGHCEDCRAKAERDGKSKLYVDYLKEIARYVVKLGRRPVLWADMLLKHPEAAGEMPKESIFVDWNYGWKPNYFGDISQVEHKGFEMWGAAALRCHPDNHSVTCWERHFDNIRDFIPYARVHGYKGMILTSWSTSGIYGIEWDHGSEVMEMYPLRRAYPLAGFRILEAAYAESLKQHEPIVPEEFVKRYAAERFGLSTTDGAKLWRSLTLNGTPIQRGVDVSALHARALEIKKTMASLSPLRHENEFEHLRLMADLREFHTRFKKLENEIQSPQFSLAQIPSKTRMLARLIKESQTLDQRFLRINKGFLYEKELVEDAAVRTKKLRKLYDRLTRAGRKSAKAPQTSTRRTGRRWNWVAKTKGAIKEAPQVPFPLGAVE
jgi:hexosaminidase